MNFTLEKELTVDIIVMGYHKAKNIHCGNPECNCNNESADESTFESFEICINGVDIADHLPQRVIIDIINEIHKEANNGDN